MLNSLTFSQTLETTTKLPLLTDKVSPKHIDIPNSNIIPFMSCVQINGGMKPSHAKFHFISPRPIKTGLNNDIKMLQTCWQMVTHL